MHAGDTIAENVDAGEWAAAEELVTPSTGPGFQPLDSFEHHHLRHELEAVADEVGGADERRVGDDCADTRRRPLLLSCAANTVG